MNLSGSCPIQDEWSAAVIVPVGGSVSPRGREVVCLDLRINVPSHQQLLSLVKYLLSLDAFAGPDEDQTVASFTWNDTGPVAFIKLGSHLPPSISIHHINSFQTPSVPLFHCGHESWSITQDR